MSRRAWDVTWILAVFALLLLGTASSASADMHEFSGRVDSASATKLVVESRGADKLSFSPAKQVVVSGRRKSWSALRPGDLVTVSWQIGDVPRKAHRVVVMSLRGE